VEQWWCSDIETVEQLSCSSVRFWVCFRIAPTAVCLICVLCGAYPVPAVPQASLLLQLAIGLLAVVRCFPLSCAACGCPISAVLLTGDSSAGIVGSPLSRVSSAAVDVIGVCMAMLLISCRHRRHFQLVQQNCLPLLLCSCCCQKLFSGNFCKIYLSNTIFYLGCTTVSLLLLRS
jgi:hypothetical protein